MAMASQNHQTKRGDVRIYFITCMLFVCIVSGGTFLGMYICLPESESASWYPTAGMVLVGIPWIFWLLTLLYTWIKRISVIGTPSTPNNNNNYKQQQQNTTTQPTNVGKNSGSVPTATTPSSMESPVDGAGDGGGGEGGGGGGGAGHVRFGPAVVMGSGEDEKNNHHNNNVTDGSSSSSLDGGRELSDDHSRSSSSHIGANVGSSSINLNNNGVGSSIGSHESELPLFSMPS